MGMGSLSGMKPWPQTPCDTASHPHLFKELVSALQLSFLKNSNSTLKHPSLKGDVVQCKKSGLGCQEPRFASPSKDCPKDKVLRQCTGTLHSDWQVVTRFLKNIVLSCFSFHYFCLASALSFASMYWVTTWTNSAFSTQETPPTMCRNSQQIFFGCYLFTCYL